MHQEKEATRENPRDELHRVLPGMPLHLSRLGLVLVFATLLLLAGLAAGLNYPDSIKTPVILTTSNLPARLSFYRSGLIDTVFARDGEEVETGALLVKLKSSARRQEIDSLESALTRLLAMQAIGDLTSFRFPSSLKAGTLGGDYASFVRSFQNLRDQLDRDLRFQKILSLERQVRKLEELNISLGEQEKVLSRIAELALNDLTRMQDPKNRSAISVLEKEKAEIDYLEYKRREELLKADQLNNAIRMEELRQDRLDLKEEISQLERDRWLELRRQAAILLSGIAEWKQQYLLKASFAGRIVFSQPLLPGAYVSSGEPLLSLVPPDSSAAIIAYGFLPPGGEGRIAEGARASIRLTGFPSRRFGLLRGRVTRLAGIPGPQGRRLTIELPENLLTTYGLSLEFQQEMQGEARIYAEKRSLLQRLAEPVRAALKNN